MPTFFSLSLSLFFSLLSFLFSLPFIFQCFFYFIPLFSSPFPCLSFTPIFSSPIFLFYFLLNFPFFLPPFSLPLSPLFLSLFPPILSHCFFLLFPSFLPFSFLFSIISPLFLSLSLFHLFAEDNKILLHMTLLVIKGLLRNIDDMTKTKAEPNTNERLVFSYSPVHPHPTYHHIYSHTRLEITVFPRS